MKLLAVVAVVLVATYFLAHEVQPLNRVVSAQKGPVIHSVEPERPECIVLNSDVPSYRTLTILGENLAPTPGTRLQFQLPGTGNITILFGLEVNWESAERITVDMRLIKQHLWNIPRMTLQVRLTNARGDALTEWSDRFNVATDLSECGHTGSGAVSTLGLTSFPPIPPIRGIVGDLWADVVIGKRDFAEIIPSEVVPSKVTNPGGVVVDRSVKPGRAYVWDSGNSRILGIDLSVCYESTSPCSADLVIGQPSSSDYGACNGDGGLQYFPVRAAARRDTLCGIPETAISPIEEHTFVTMAVSIQGDLYVPDSHNNRVLKYESPFEKDPIADEVWGQSDFSGITCNRGLAYPSAETLCFHSPTNRSRANRYGNGVEIDADGNLWVADGGNNRILRFPADATAGEIAKTADLVLGQPDFDSSGLGTTLDRFHAPSAIGFGPTGRLYVADTINDRVLVFEPPFSSGMEAVSEYGRNLYRPTSIDADPGNQGMWINDSGNHMVELWDWDGVEVTRVLGKDSYRPDRKCGAPLTGLPGSPHMCNTAGGIGIDGDGNVLIPLYLPAHDVVRFKAPIPAIDSGKASRADRRLFYPPIGSNQMSDRRLVGNGGVAVFEDQLIVSEYGRLLFWNGIEDLSNGKPADGVIGARSWRHWLSCCGRIKVDDAGRLWVLAFEGIGFVDVYQLPLTEYSVPMHTIWTSGSDSGMPVLDDGFQTRACSH